MAADRPCAGCGRTVTGPRYPLARGAVCLRCALRDRALLGRSLRVALVVGTLLVAINQADTLIAGPVTSGLVMRIGLTYVVPFCVATYGALAHARGRAGGGAGGGDAS